MADQANSERLRRLEDDVNQRVRDAFEGLREEVGQRLRRLSDEAQEALEGLGQGQPPSVLAAADIEPVVREAAREAESAAGHRAAGELLAAVAAIDRAGSQGEVLSALAREASRFAGRTALLLTRPSGAELWSAEGWSDVPSSLVFGYPDADGWSPDAFGRGAVELSGGALGELSSRLGADAPARALLVPLVLRDRLAAVLYADGGGEAAAAAPAPLQVLTWAASQALESLPFRRRAATPTLAGLGSAEPGSGPLALWGSEGAAGAAEPKEDEGHATGKAVGIAAAGIAAAGLAAAGVAKARRDRHDEEEEEGGDVAAAAEPAPPGTDALAAFDEVTLEEGPGPEVAAPPVSFGGEPAASRDGELAAETAASDAGWSFEGATAPAAEPEADAERGPSEAELAPAEDQGALAAEESGVLAAEGAAPFGEERPAAGLDVGQEPPALPDVGAGDDETLIEDQTHPAAPTPPQDVAAPPAGASDSAAAERADETYPGFAAAPPTAGPPAEAPPVVAPRAAAGGSAEVAPPADLEGPGRAFAGRGEAPRDEEQARHDEARRLARLLVSEIRLYNEDEVEAGRRNGDVYERLKEDIDRSRQLYEERVDQGVREGTDYFYQELVRNLAGGDARALGI